LILKDGKVTGNRKEAGKMAASLNNNSDDNREKGWTRLACAAEAGDIDRVLELLAGADRSGIGIDPHDLDSSKPVSTNHQYK
jgi:hypothetical protein